MSSTGARGGVTSIDPSTADAPVTASAAPVTSTPPAMSAARPTCRSIAAARLASVVTLES